MDIHEKEKILWFACLHYFWYLISVCLFEIEFKNNAIVKSNSKWPTVLLIHLLEGFWMFSKI